MRNFLNINQESVGSVATLKTEDIIGFPVAAEPFEVCLQQIADCLATRKELKFFACANPHSLVVAMQDLQFRQALLSADILVPDGVGIIIASKILGGTIRRRITGSDVFAAVNEMVDKLKGSVFFLGSTDRNLATIKERMTRDYPAIQILGTYSPPFKHEFSASDSAAMIEAVNHARPDVLWVGMTAPKQEKWVYQNLRFLDVGFVGAVGAVFDFYTGRIQRSHLALRRIGLEWLPRLLKEPRRLWRRNLISNPAFLWHVFRFALLGIIKRQYTIRE
jgi:N-acetylglucosaminyldiphosphoundecaprenol N-acetyl-beta-D-mannosaminyltransferase